MRKFYTFAAGLLLTLIFPFATLVANDHANFTTTISAPGNHVFFTNTSILDGPGLRKGVWSFGDGSSFSAGPLDNATHTYNATGNYTVCLRIYRFSTANNDSVLTSEECKTVVIQTAPDSCSADFERIPSSTANPLRVYFRALPWHNNNKHPENICWHFGDGTDTCIHYDPSQVVNYVVAHNYAQNGNYNVCVRISYQGGCVAEKCKYIQVGETDSCSADFQSVSPSPTSLSKYFTALPWNNHNKKPLRVCWQFGDGTDTCIQYTTTYTGSYSVNHIYAAPGEYNVCVRILYDGGCESYKCKSVQVGVADECRADFEKIQQAATNNPLHVYYRALPWNNHQRKPSQVCWEFGDGRDTCIQYPENYTGQYVVAHDYNHAGLYEVCVRIRYYGGCEAHKCKMVLVNAIGDQCHVRLLEGAQSATSLSRNFYAVTGTTINSPAHRICWRFGDGTDTCIILDSNSTGPYHITHTYPGPGTYHACVNVLFVSGCTAEDCREVVIRSVSGICGGYMTDSLTDAHTYAFHGVSIHNPNDEAISFRWTFGDGSSGTGASVVHSYNAPGIYRVCLLINTRSGCETRI
jgi:PKD repeat protein